MNREIKFRAWISKKEEMSDPFTFDDFDGDYFIPCGVYLSDLTIMQLTGRKAKNGRPIYEGDIVQSRFLNQVTTCIVKIGEYTENIDFDTSHNIGVYLETVDKQKRTMSICHDEDIEVIGNIYENRDLLEVK